MPSTLPLLGCPATCSGRRERPATPLGLARAVRSRRTTGRCPGRQASGAEVALEPEVVCAHGWLPNTRAMNGEGEGRDGARC